MSADINIVPTSCWFGY